MIVLKVLFIYSLFVILTYFILALLIKTNQGVGPEDNAARMMALLFASIIWPITIILIIYNNVKRRFRKWKE